MSDSFHSANPHHRITGLLCIFILALSIQALLANPFVLTHLRTIPDTTAFVRAFEPVALLALPEGKLLVSEASRCVILQFDSAGRPLAEFGGCGNGTEEMGQVGGIAKRRGTGFFVCDTDHRRIIQLDDKLRKLSLFSPVATVRNKLFAPTIIATGRDDALFMADPDEGSILFVERDNKLRFITDPRSTGMPHTVHPSALAVIDNLYLADATSHSLFALDRFGTLLFQFGKDCDIPPFGLTSFSNRHLVASLANRNALQIFSLYGDSVCTLIPQAPTGPIRATAISIFGNHLYLINALTRKIELFRITD